MCFNIFFVGDNHKSSFFLVTDCITATSIDVIATLFGLLLLSIMTRKDIWNHCKSQSYFAKPFNHINSRLYHQIGETFRLLFLYYWKMHLPVTDLKVKYPCLLDIPHLSRKVFVNIFLKFLSLTGKVLPIHEGWRTFPS